MQRRSNPQSTFFQFAILLFSLLLIAYIGFLLCLSTTSLRSFTSTSPTTSHALTNNTLTLPPDSPISPAYLIDLSHSNAIAFAQSQLAAYTSNIINSVTNRIPTYHLLTTYNFAPSHTLPDLSYISHNDPITTKELLIYISRLSELLASGVIESATLTLTLTTN